MNSFVAAMSADTVTEIDTAEGDVVESPTPVQAQPSSDFGELIPDFSRKVSVSDSDDLIIIESDHSCPTSADTEKGLKLDSQHLYPSQPSAGAIVTEKDFGEAGEVKPSVDKEAAGVHFFELEADTASTSTVAVSSENLNSEKLPFVCVCGERFEKSVYMAAHKRWSCKMKEQKAQCDVCKSWFASDLGLKRHIKHAHGGVFSCDRCNLRFHNKIKLTRHWMEAHYNDKDEESKLKCYVCGATDFNSNFALDCHLDVHKRERKTKMAGRPYKASPHFSSSAEDSNHPPPPFHPYHHFHHHHHGGGHPHGSSTNDAPPWAEFRPPWAGFRPPWTGGRPPWAGSRPPWGGFRPPWGGFGPPWAHFPFDHSDTRPAAAPPPPAPPPPPPPPHFPWNTETSELSFSQGSNNNVNPQQASDENGNSTPATSRVPRHDHPFPNHENFALDSHPIGNMHVRHGHKFKHKGKWKKYMKAMLLNEMTMGAGSGRDKLESNNEEVLGFQMACKFCDKIIDRNALRWHQTRECPVLSVHRCMVCSREFRKRCQLIKHMHEYNHYQVPRSVSQMDSSFQSGDTSTLSSLQDKMNSSLNLVTRPEDNHNYSQSVNDTSAIVSHAFVEQKANCSSNVAQEENVGVSQAKLISSEKERGVSDTHKTEHQCHTCKQYLTSKGALLEHLRDHINQALVVQKVEEWTRKSSEYFRNHVGNEIDEDSGNDFESTTATTTSFIDGMDSEIASTVDTSIYDASSASNTCHQESTMEVCKDLKWTKHREKDSNKGRRVLVVCDICKERLYFLKDVKYHMETKHKDLSLECPVCQKKFSWKKRGLFYQRHLNSHYGVTVFKHTCEVCGKKFLEKSKLSAHMSRHTEETPFKCSTCGKGYGNKSSLVRHERKHTGEKPYKCSECDESFMEKRELVRHSVVHTGKAPFSCDMCGQGFTLKTSLMAHIKKKHSK